MSVNRSIIAAVAAFSLTATPALAAVAQPVAPAPVQQVSPWLALAAMSGGSGAVAACGAAVVQGAGCVLGQMSAPPPAPINQPIPIPPAEVGGIGVGGIFANPLLLALGAAALAGIVYAVVQASNNNDNSPA